MPLAILCCHAVMLIIPSHEGEQLKHYRTQEYLNLLLVPAEAERYALTYVVVDGTGFQQCYY
jgi:hypothetical protein